MKKFATEVRLSREMQLMDVTLIGVGAMIGAGIFVLTGIAAGVAGPALILTFLFNGLVALLTAMAYAELGSCYHDAGGGYLWVKEGLPQWNGFLSGWMSWFAHAVACSLYALGFGAYFEHLLVVSGIPVPHWGFLGPQKLLAGAVAVLFAYINFRGASETGKIGNIVTISKVFILAIFVVFGLIFLIRRPDWQAPFTPFLANGWSGVIRAMGLTFIAFQGFEVISQCSEEVNHPRRNIPRAVFLSLLIVVPIYVLVAVAALGSVAPGEMTPWDYLAQQKEIALVEVARRFFRGGNILILVGGVVSTMSALNATIYSSSRVAFAMGRDRNFPTFFSRVHSRNFTPHWAILVSTFIVVGMAVSLPIEDVASATDIMFLLLFFQVNLAMIRLRKKRPDLDRGFTTPYFPWLSIFAIALLLFLAIYMFTYSPKAWMLSAVWMSVGLVIYRSYASKREVRYLQRVEALGRLEKREYKVLVSLSKPESVLSLCHIAIAVAKRHSAEVILTHVVEVEEGEPLAAGLTDTAPLQSFLDAARLRVEGEGIPARSILRVSHRISRGILDTAEEERCNLIVLGRQKNPTFIERFFASSIDAVIQQSPLEVIVMHGTLQPDKVRNILIPFDKNVHTRLAIDVAPALADHFRAKVSIAAVLEPDAHAHLKAETLSAMEQLARESSLTAEVQSVEDVDVLHGIVNQAKEADLVLMGGRAGDFLELLVGRSLTQEITEEVTCPVLWVKEYEERESFWSSLLNRGEKVEA